VIGGVAIWTFTKEAPKPPPTAKVLFEKYTPAHFKSDSKNLMFNIIRIGNFGDKAATDVILSVEFPKDTEILDFTISNSSGAAARNNQKELPSNTNEKLFSIKSLMPDEIVTASILTKGDLAEKLLISARYTDGVAEQGSLNKGVKFDLSEGKPQAEKAALSALILGILLPIMLFRLRRTMGGRRSPNNSAFMMLHQGMVEDAAKLLENELMQRGGTSFELANLGLCKALAGDSEDSEKLFTAAELYSPSKSIKSLVAFNRSISYYESGDVDAAKKQFEIASSLGKSTVRKYVKISKYAQALVNNIPEFNEYIPSES